MWARIENLQVVEITDVNPAGRFHKSLTWVTCQNDTVIGDIYDGENFIKPTQHVADIATNKVAELKQLCRETIFAGFDSDALGAIHHYPLSQSDQANLQKNESAASRNLGTDGWVCYCQCVDVNGVLDYRPHTASQMLQVADDIQEAKDGLLYVTLRGKIQHVLGIQADDTLADDEKRQQIEAVVW